MTDRALTYGRALLAAPPGETGPIEFVASSPGLNRYGFSLRPEGWRLDAFNANSVVLWAHDATSPPIGSALAAVKDNRLVAEVTFDPEDPFARQVESKYRRGFLNAVSVGFDFVDEAGAPLDWWRMSADKIRDEAFYDLAEISSVPVPADPGALIKQSRLARLELGRELVIMLGGKVPDETDFRAIVADEVAACLEHRGLHPGTPDPEPARDAAGIPDDAARRLLAAFAPQGGQP